MTHNDVTRPEFGYTADPRDFFGRAYDAAQLASLMRNGDARYLADVYVADPAGWQAPVAADFYSRSVAAHAYAEAVYNTHAPTSQKATA